MNGQWRLIFDSVKDGRDNDSFHKKVLDHPNVLLLIGLNGGECIVGGYTKTGWRRDIDDTEESEDKDAFVFQIRSPDRFNRDSFISNVKKETTSISQAIDYSTNEYGIFGCPWVFCLNGAEYIQYYQGSRSTFEDFPSNMIYLACTAYDECPYECEAFQIFC